MFTGEPARTSGASINLRETEEDEREAPITALDTPTHEAGVATSASGILSPASSGSESRAPSPADSPSPPHSPVPASALEPAPVPLAMALSMALDPKTLAEGVAAFESAEVNAPVPAHPPTCPELPKEARPGPRIPSPPGRTSPPDTSVPAPAPAGPALEQSSAERAAPIPGLTVSVEVAQRELQEAEKNVEEANRHAEDMARKYAELTGVDSDVGRDTSDTESEASKVEQREELELEEPQIHPVLLEDDGAATGRGLFKAAQLGVDRRLLVNRKRQLKMYRVWVQAQFEKL